MDVTTRGGQFLQPSVSLRTARLPGLRDEHGVLCFPLEV